LLAALVEPDEPIYKVEAVHATQTSTELTVYKVYPVAQEEAD
jgi:hypothetical protein